MEEGNSFMTFKTISAGYETLLRFSTVSLLAGISGYWYPDWSLFFLTVILALLSSWAVLTSQTFFLVAWISLDSILHVPFPSQLGEPESLFRLFQCGILLALFFLRKPLTLPLPEDDPRARRAGALLAGLGVCLGIASFFRPFPLQFSVWALVAFLYAHSLNKSSLFRSMKAFASLGTGLVLVFAILEIGTRWILPVQGRPASSYMRDKNAITTLRPGGQDWYKLLDNSGNIIKYEEAISAQGIRDREFGPKKPDEFRILTVGDSYTMGYGLPCEETFQRELERLLNQKNLPKRVTVVNCGVGGYAPWQERHFLNARGFDFEPDLVLLQLFPSNDVAGSYSRVGKFLQAIDTNWEQILLDARRQNESPFYLERWCRLHSNLYRVVCSLRKKPGLVRNLVLSLRLVPKIEYVLPEITCGRNPYHEAALVHWYPELHEAWAILEESVQGIRDDCRKRGVPLAAFVHGVYVSLTPEYWAGLRIRFPDSPYEMNKDIRLANEMLERLGIPHPDVLAAFQAHPVPEELYYVNDGHFSPRGAKVVAQCLCDFLMETYFSGQRQTTDTTPGRIQ